MRKKEYLDSLKSLENNDGEAVEPQEPVKPVVVEKETAPKPEPVAKPVEPVAPVVAAEPELFAGFNALPEDRRKEITERWKLADEAKAKADEAARLQHELRQSQSRLAPTQQQLSRQQLENAALQKKLNEFTASQAKTANTALRQKIDAMKEQFPDDAAMWEGVLAEIESTKQSSGTVREEIQTLREQSYITSQLQMLSQAHPDWQNKRVGVYVDPATGAHSIRRAVETQDAVELEVWGNSLDPYDRGIVEKCLVSKNAQDTIYVLNRFEQDRAIARALAGQHAAPAIEPAPAATAAPVADPDPQRRTTAPAARSAGQPMSDKKRALIAAADEMRRQGKLPPLQHRRA